MVINTLAISSKVGRKGRVSICIRVAPITRANGRMIRKMARASIIMQAERHTTENG